MTRTLPWTHPIPTALLLVLSVLGLPLVADPPRIHLDRPTGYQVVQRSARGDGSIPVSGSLSRGAGGTATVEARLSGGTVAGDWRKVCEIGRGQTHFTGEVRVPAGGWCRLEVRIRRGRFTEAEAAVEKVGVGEVFIVAGQSNSANHGEERQRTKSGRVAAFHGGVWRLADDPQPGASGDAGSFIPPFGDALVERFDVPVGIIAVGVGATSVREWLPRGTRFPNPPTLTGNVAQLPDGSWESRGALFQRLVDGAKSAGPHGFRAILWHQGESDARQADGSHTLPGRMYRQFLGDLIRDVRREIGWEAPWFVAQASYHTPDDPGSPDIRAAQRALWSDGLALEGPDSDALVGELRDGGGRGVHFSGKGLRTHGTAWAEKVGDWIGVSPEVGRPSRGPSRGPSR